jgi:hypothetical protein
MSVSNRRKKKRRLKSQLIFRGDDFFVLSLSPNSQPLLIAKHLLSQENLGRGWEASKKKTYSSNKQAIEIDAQ